MVLCACTLQASCVSKAPEVIIIDGGLVANPSKCITHIALVVFVQRHVICLLVEAASSSKATGTPFPASTAILLKAAGLALGHGDMLGVWVRPTPRAIPNLFTLVLESGTLVLGTTGLARC